ncbi:hypothetical protein SDC9_52267 [bioreactor metagenome]|uniref:Lipoprotein n=1 Tax=bioreactor metagenome TaxID=1076179 RepID=A0A644WQG4_9ZZZZ
MKMNLRLFVIVFVSILVASCSKTTYNALRSTDVSGDSLTFSFLDMNCNTESGIYYKVMYNDSALVLESCVLNETTQQKILMKGLSVWIDTSDKSKKETGIVFPYHNKPQMHTEGGRPDPFADAASKKLPPHADVQLWRSEAATAVLSSGPGIDAQMTMNKNKTLLLRLSVNYDLLGLSLESLKARPFSVVLMTSPLMATKPQSGGPGGPDNGAETGNPQMYGSNNQNPFGQSNPGNFGNPGGGSYGSGGHGDESGEMQQNTSAAKSDKIVVRHIVLKQ